MWCLWKVLTPLDLFSLYRSWTKLHFFEQNKNNFFYFNVEGKTYCMCSSQSGLYIWTLQGYYMPTIFYICRHYEISEGSQIKVFTFVASSLIQSIWFHSTDGVELNINAPALLWTNTGCSACSVVCLFFGETSARSTYTESFREKQFVYF